MRCNSDARHRSHGEGRFIILRWVVDPAHGCAAIAMPVMRAATQDQLGPGGGSIGSLLGQVPQISDQCREVSFIRQFESGNIVELPLRRDHRSELACLCIGIGHQHSGDPSIAILEGVDAHKFMVQPRRLEFRGQIEPVMAFMECKEPVDFGLHLFSRAVFMDEAVLAPRVVGSYLPLSPPERDLGQVAEGISPDGACLVAGRERMPFLDRRAGQRTLILHMGEQHFERRLLVFKQAP